jgi:hypothetical protein
VPGESPEDSPSEEEAGWAAPHLPSREPARTESMPATSPSAPPASPSAPSTAPPVWSAPSPAWAPGQPGGQQPPSLAPRPRRRRRWPWVLAGALFVIVVLLIAGIGLFVAKVKPPIDDANAYLGDIADRDYESAFDRLCEAERVDGSATTFAADLEGVALLSDVDEFEITPFGVDVDGDSATVDVDLAPDDLGAFDAVVDLQLEKEDGDWRPCGGFYGFRFELGELD